MAEGYVFATAQEATEAQRLQLIELENDIFSQSRLSALGLTEGSNCLELGLGTGSMARWMSSVAGVSGRVVGVDIDSRFFPLVEGHGIELICADIRSLQFDEGTFDFIHARLLLEHIPDRDEMLPRLVRWLKPGGWMVLADTDYSFPHRATGDGGDLWNRVQAATADAVTARGADFRLGMKLPGLMIRSGLNDVRAHGAFSVILDPATNGRILQAALELQRQLVDLADVPAGKIAELQEALPNGTVVQTGYTLIVAWGQRPVDRSDAR